VGLRGRVGQLSVRKRGHDLRRVHARVDRVLPGAERLLPDAAVWPGRTIEPNLNSAPRCRPVGSPTNPFNHRDLALVHDEHGHEVDGG